MCGFEILEGMWETSWDTAASDKIIHYPFWNGTTIQDPPMKLILGQFESPNKPKKKSKWMEKKLKRYDR